MYLPITVLFASRSELDLTAACGRKSFLRSIARVLIDEYEIALSVRQNSENHARNHTMPNWPTTLICRNTSQAA